MGQLTEEVRAVVESVYAALPEECATFFVEDDPSATGGGVTFSLTPWSSSAAPIVINSIESEVTIIAGKESRFEFPIRNASQRQHALNDVKRICEAVVSGRFAESIWSVGEEVVRVDGRVCTGDEVLKTSSRFAARLFSKKAKAIVNYAPYCGIEGD